MSGFVYRSLKGFVTRIMYCWGQLAIKARTVSVRELQPGDVARVHHAFRSVGAQPLPAELMGQSVDKTGIVVAWLGACPIGIGFIHWDGPRNAEVQQRFPGVPEIYRLWVRPRYRAVGLGSQVVHHIESLALVRGLGRIGLGVHAGNQRAHALYLRLDYQPDPQTYVDSYLERGSDGLSRQVNESAIFMVKTLGGSNKP